MAFFSADMGNYPAAIKIFEEVGRKAADNNLLRFSARGHLLNAGLCHLAGAPCRASAAFIVWDKRQQLRRNGLCAVLMWLQPTSQGLTSLRLAPARRLAAASS